MKCVYRKQTYETVKIVDCGITTITTYMEEYPDCYGCLCPFYSVDVEKHCLRFVEERGEL